MSANNAQRSMEQGAAMSAMQNQIRELVAERRAEKMEQRLRLHTEHRIEQARSAMQRQIDLIQIRAEIEKKASENRRQLEQEHKQTQMLGEMQAMRQQIEALTQGTAMQADMTALIKHKAKSDLALYLDGLDTTADALLTFTITDGRNGTIHLVASTRHTM